MSDKILQFSLAVNSIPVTIGDKEYEIREMTALARDTHMDSVNRRLVFDAEKKKTVLSQMEGMQADLVSRCLVEKSTGRFVAVKTIQEWPSNVVQGLYEACQEHNKLGAAGKEAATEAKKE